MKITNVFHGGSSRWRARLAGRACSTLANRRLPFGRCVALSLAASAGIVAGCKPGGAAANAVTAQPAVPVQIALVQQLDVPRIIDSVGAVQALRTVAVKSQVDGMIAQIHFKEGDEMKAGDLLVTLDRRPFGDRLLAWQRDDRLSHSAVETRSRR